MSGIRDLAALLKGGNNILMGVIDQVYDDDIYDVSIGGCIVKKVPAQLPPGVTRKIKQDATANTNPVYESSYRKGQAVSILKTTKSMSNLIITGVFKSNSPGFTTFSY